MDYIISNLYAFIELLFFPVCTIVSLCFSIKYIKIIRKTKKEEIPKGTIPKLVCSVSVCILSLCVIIVFCAIMSVFNWNYKPITWVKNNFSQEELNIICKELGLTPTEEYQIESAKYVIGEELSVYLHVDDEAADTLQYAHMDVKYYSEKKLKEYVSGTDGVVGFFKDVCGYPETYLEKEIRYLGNLNHLDKAECEQYKSMYGETYDCIKIYPYDKEEYMLCAYIWKEEDGYGIEVKREQGMFYTVTERELYEIFSKEEVQK